MGAAAICNVTMQYLCPDRGRNFPTKFGDNLSNGKEIETLIWKSRSRRPNFGFLVFSTSC